MCLNLDKIKLRDSAHEIHRLVQYTDKYMHMLQNKVCMEYRIILKLFKNLISPIFEKKTTINLNTMT